SLIVADRTLRLLFGGRARSPLPGAPPPQAPEPDPAGRSSSEATLVEPADEAPAPGEAEASAEPALPQASLDGGLLAAVRSGDAANVRDWLARGANPDAVPAAGARDQRSALILAAEL